MQGWVASPWARRAVTFMVGMSIFFLGVMYLRLGQGHDVTSFLIAGGTGELWPGTDTALRLGARLHDARRNVPLTLGDVHLDGKLLDVSQEGDFPLIVRFHVPPELRGKSTLTLQVKSQDTESTLSLPVEAVPRASEDLDLSLERKLPKITTAHRIEVYPESGELPMQMENRVFIQLRRLDGVPLPGGMVTIRHSSLGEAPLTLYTDENGLAHIKLTAKQPSVRLDLTVEAEGKLTHTEALLRPYGRKLTLDQTPVVTHPDTPVEVSIKSWKNEVLFYCDLLEQTYWRWSGRVRTQGKTATLDLGPLEEGRYDLQCYDHSLEPGESYATLPIVVSSNPPLKAMLSEAAANDLCTHHACDMSNKGNLERTLRFWRTRLQRKPRSPAVLLNTRQEVLTARQEENDRQKQKLLWTMAAVFALVLLWAIEAVLKNILETRDRLKAFAYEHMLEGDEALEVESISNMSTQRRTLLVRTRGMLFLLVIVGTILANILGILGLFALIR